MTKISQLHLRRVGLEAKPALLQGVSGDGSSGSSSDEKKGGGHLDKPPEDHGSPGAGDGGGHQPQASGSEVHGLGEQFLSNREITSMTLGTLCFLMQVPYIPSLLQFYMSALYTTRKRHSEFV